MKYVLFSLDVLSYCLSNSYWFYSLNIHQLLFLILGFFFTLQESDSVLWSSLSGFLTTLKSPFILIFTFLLISTFLFNLFLSLSFVLSFGIIPQDSCVQCSLVSWSLNLFLFADWSNTNKEIASWNTWTKLFHLAEQRHVFLCTDLFCIVSSCSSSCPVFICPSCFKFTLRSSTTHKFHMWLICKRTGLVVYPEYYKEYGMWIFMTQHLELDLQSENRTLGRWDLRF